MTFAVIRQPKADRCVLNNRVGSRLAIFVLIWLLVVVAGHHPAGANLADAGANMSQFAGGADVELVVTEGEQRVDVGTGAVPGWVRECRGDRWSLLEKERFFAGFTGFDGDHIAGELGDPDEVWAVVFCPVAGHSRGFVSSADVTGVYATWPLGEQPPRRFVDLVVSRAYARLRLPESVSTSAPEGSFDIPMITQLPTWLWVDQEVWQPQVVSSGQILGFEAVLTATPVNVVFTGARGEWVDCGANEGPPYNFNLHEDAQHSGCVLTYRDSTSVGDWGLTTSIRWELAWACRPGCGTGTLPDQVITTTRPVRVAEIQAVLIPDR